MIGVAYPGREVLAGKPRPLIGGGRLLPEAVEVVMLQELLTGQPLGRVHPQTALRIKHPD